MSRIGRKPVVVPEKVKVRVEKGEVFVIVRHGKPIAEISPASSEPRDSPSWKKPGLRLTAKGASLSAAILQERRREDVL